MNADEFSEIFIAVVINLTVLMIATLLVTTGEYILSYLSDNKKTIILISGWKGSGKDTYAAHLCKKRGFSRFAFADALKEKVAQDYNISLASMHDVHLKEIPIKERPVISTDNYSKMVQESILCHFRTLDRIKPVAPFKPYYNEEKCYWNAEPLFWTRRALLILEASTKRSFEPNYWVQKISSIKHKRNIIVTDWRYENELKIVEEIFSATHRIIRIRIDVETLPESFDESERSLDLGTFDIRVVNKKNGFSSFYENVDKLLTAML